MRKPEDLEQIQQIDKKIEHIRKIIAIKSYVSYESDLKDKMYLDRLYKLKEKIEQRKEL